MQWSTCLGPGLKWLIPGSKTLYLSMTNDPHMYTRLSVTHTKIHLKWYPYCLITISDSELRNEGKTGFALCLCMFFLLFLFSFFQSSVAIHSSVDQRLCSYQKGRATRGQFSHRADYTAYLLVLSLTHSFSLPSSLYSTG